VGIGENWKMGGMMKGINDVAVKRCLEALVWKA
jgi:hypothetical protein